MVLALSIVFLLCIPNNISADDDPFLFPFIRDYKPIEIGLDENGTLDLKYSFNVSWDLMWGQKWKTLTSKISFSLNGSLIGEYETGPPKLDADPREFTEKEEIELIHANVQPGQYDIQINLVHGKWKYERHQQLAINYTTAFLLTDYGAGFLDDTDQFIAYSAETYVGGRVWYFGKEEVKNCSVMITEGKDILKSTNTQIENGTREDISWTEYEPAENKVRIFEIKIGAGTLELASGGLKVHQDVYPKVGDRYFTVCCIILIASPVILIVVLYIIVDRIRVKKRRMS